MYKTVNFEFNKTTPENQNTPYKSNKIISMILNVTFDRAIKTACFQTDILIIISVQYLTSHKYFITMY